MAFNLVKKGAIKVDALAVTNKLVVFGTAAATGQWLIISWATLTPAEIVRVEFDDPDDGDALGADYESVHPVAGRAWVWIGGRSKVFVSGASAFNVSLRVI